MKEIVIISGKGGTGKTSVMTAISYLAGNKAVVADCDVDAADVHLLLKPEILKREDFYSGVFATIHQQECISCGLCKETCRFDAIDLKEKCYEVDVISCEGCGYCALVCPTKAIEMLPQKAGEWFISKTRVNNTLVHATLGIGAENSGKLVAKVKTEAKRIAKESKCEYVIVDGAPGVGCPVISSITGADYVVFVTEPTVAGLHDLDRVHQVVQRFKIPSACIINKCDINLDKTQEIRAFLEKEDITLLAELPYDEAFTKAMLVGKTIAEYPDEKNNPIKEKLEHVWTILQQK